MGVWRQWLLTGALVLGCLPGAAWAESEVDILLNKLVDKGILSNVEAGQIRREIAETKVTRNKQLAKEIVPDSSRNWKWSGDLRLRNEYRNRTGSGQDVNRQRIRFRYGVDAKVADDLRVVARLATGSTTDPVSTNQSLNNAFNHNTIVLDRAFLEYAPELPFLSKTAIQGGILENPFWVVGSLVWDEDLNFDGLAVKLEKSVIPELTVFTTNGIFPIQTDVQEAANLWGSQSGVVFQPFVGNLEDELQKNFKVAAALAYYDYQNVTNPFSENAAFAQAGGAAGQTPATPTAAQLKGNTAGVADFNLLNSTFEVGSQYRDVPFSLFGDFVHNTSLASSNNTGFQFGVKLGKARIPFDPLKGWEGGYFFERLEPNATFGPYTESDFGNGGTDHRGHVFWVKLATMKNSSFQLKYFNTQELKGSKNHADTFQADWVTKF